MARPLEGFLPLIVIAGTLACARQVGAGGVPSLNGIWTGLPQNATISVTQSPGSALLDITSAYWPSARGVINADNTVTITQGWCGHCNGTVC